MQAISSIGACSASPGPEIARRGRTLRQYLNVADEVAATVDVGELALRLKRLTHHGLLAVADPDQAATHLVLLTATEVSNRAEYTRTALQLAEVTRIVTAGIQTFLRGYQAATEVDSRISPDRNGLIDQTG